MLACIILAAGQSTRMHSKTSKVLHDLSGKPIIGHVLDAIRGLNPHQTLLVVPPSFDTTAPLFRGIIPVIQAPPLGTGHAVKIAFSKLDQSIDDVIIICGDTPLIRTESLTKLYEHDADFVIMTAQLAHDQLHLPYGRIVFDGTVPTRIVEYKDADDNIKNSSIINSGIYKIKRILLEKLIHSLSSNNVSGEYYLTDCLHMAIQHNARTAHIVVPFDEMMGVNTRIELSLADSIMQTRLKKQLMASGVTLFQPETIRVSVDTRMGQDTIIDPLLNHVMKRVFPYIILTCVLFILLLLVVLLTLGIIVFQMRKNSVLPGVE
jgi:bifunctional UDP-N-acetylglucosamine pyrophosphorylase/glucosamine-1-phosphate N-acetyltransferase